MSSKVVIGLLASLLLTIIGWWVNRVNNSMDITQQLQWKDQYLNGNIPAAPVAPVAPPAIKK